MKEHSSLHLEDPAFQSLLVELLEKLERGESLDSAALQIEYPQYAEPLSDFLDDLDLLKQIAGDVRDSMVGPRNEPHESVIEPTIGSTPPVNGYAVGDSIKYIGEYKILEEIARGGMGVVFKAKQERLKRVVALKMILSGRLADDADIQRFQREAQAAAKLQHPNIVAVHEIGQHEGHHYFTMDLVEGQSLSDAIREETLPPREAARIIRIVAEAIQAAHDQGTLHRDLKPANILINTAGEPKVTDFGLAKVLDELDDDSRLELTATGQILGTPSYMSPEQAEGKHSHIGPSTDVYSLGAVLYACLTGRAPFVANSPVDTLLQVVREDPPSLRVLNPSIPRDLENICLKCLAKEPHKRYGKAQDLADDLTRFLEGRPVHARPVGPLAKAVRWCRRNPVVASLLLLVAISLLGGTAIASYFAVQANNQLQVAIAEKQRADDALKDAETARKQAVKAKEDAEDARDEADISAGIARQNEQLAEQQTAIAEQQAAIADQRRIEAEEARKQEAEQRQRAEKEKKNAQWQTYVARLQPMRQALLEKEFGHLDRLLQESIPKEGEPDFRGWEWYYLNNRVTTASQVIVRNPKISGFLQYDSLHDRILVDEGEHWTVRSIATGESINALELNGVRKESLRLSPDGTKLAYSTLDGILRIFDVQEGDQLLEIDARSERAGMSGNRCMVAWKPDGNQIASGSRSGEVKIWNATTGELVSELQKAGEKNLTDGIDWHAKGGLVTGHRHGWVKNWDVEKRELRWSARFGNGFGSVVLWNPAGTKVAVDSGRTVIFTADGEIIGSLPAISGRHNVAWLDNEQLAIGGSSQDLLLASLNDLEKLSQFKIHSGRINGLAVDRNGHLLSGALDGSIRRLNMDAPIADSEIIDAHDAYARGIAWGPDSQRIATTGHDGTPRIWRAKSGELLRELKSQNQNSGISDVAWNYKTGELATIDFGNNLLLWNPDSGDLLASGRAPEGVESAISWSPSGKQLAVGCRGVHIMNMPSFEVTASSPKGYFKLFPAFSPDGAQVAAVGHKGNVRLVDVETGKFTFLDSNGFTDAGGGVAWSPDGRLFAAGGNTIRIYESRSRQPLGDLAGHRGNVLSVDFHPGGKRIASVGSDNNLLIWDAETGDLLIRLPTGSENNGLQNVQWSPDGRSIAAVSGNGKLYVWNAPANPGGDERIDQLDDGALNPDAASKRELAKRTQQLHELSTRIESTPDDLALLRERIELLQKMERWPEALADIELHLELSPGDTWRPAQGLMVANLMGDDEKVREFADLCYGVMNRDKANTTAKAHAAMALATSPEMVKDFTPLLQITQQHAKDESDWYHLRPHLLVLLRTQQYEELESRLAPLLTHEGLLPPHRSLVLLLEAFRLQFTEQPEAARKVFRNAQHTMNLKWERFPMQIDNSIIASLLMREAEAAFDSAEPTSLVSTAEFRIVGSWKVTVEFDETKYDEVLAALIEDDNKRNPERPTLTPAEVKDRQEYFEKMIELSTKSNGTIVFQANGELQTIASRMSPPMLPGGMTWRFVEQVDDRLTLEFRWKGGDGHKVKLKIVNANLLESLPTKGKAAPPEVLQKAMRTTWTRTDSKAIGRDIAVSKWLEMLQNESFEVREKAVSEVPEFGAGDVPTLIHAASNARQPEVHRAIDRALTNLLNDPQGEPGDWIKLLRDESELVQQVGSRGLIRYGEKALPALFKLLDEREPEIRRSVIITLARIGTTKPQTAQAIHSRLAELLKSDKDEDVRYAAASALGELHLKTQTSAKPDQHEHSDLISSLSSDKNELVRIAAAQAIGKVASPSKAAVDALVKALTGDEHAMVRYWSADAIGSLGPKAKDATPALLKALANDEDDEVRGHAAHAIKKMQATPELVLPTLLQAAKNDNEMYVRRSAVITIGMLGPAAKEAAPMLVAAMKNDTFYSVRSNAAVALAQIGSLESIPEIIEVLQSDENQSVRSDAARALAEFGPAAKEAIPALKIARDSDEAVRVKTSARFALKKIGAE